MEKLAYYDQSGTPWSEHMDKQITKEYTEDNLDIIQLGLIHKRTPGSIAYKLKALNLIEIQLDARGYQQYQASDLYREIVTTANQKTKAKKQEEKETIEQSTDQPWEQLSAYVNDTKQWRAKESEALIKEYNEDQLGLLELCKLHKRLPATIIARLKKHELIKNTTDCRGIAEYKKSDLCKAVLVAKKQKEAETVVVSAPQSSLELEVAELRDEVNSIKITLNDMQQLLKSMVDKTS